MVTIYKIITWSNKVVGEDISLPKAFKKAQSYTQEHREATSVYKRVKYFLIKV